MYKNYLGCIVCIVLMLALAGCVQTPTENGEDTDPSLSNVLDAGVIKVGSDVPYPPMEYFDEEGNIIGFDVDVIAEIAQRLGVTATVIDYDWGDIFDAVISGEVDVIISSITITLDREEEYGIMFSNPYFQCGQVIIVNESSNVSGPENLSGLVVGAQVNTTSEQEALKYTNSLLVITYKNYTEYEDRGIIYDLKNGTLDAIIVDYVVALNIVQDDPLLKIVGDHLTEEFFGIATKEGNVALINAIGDAIKEMQQDGTLDTIEDKWIET